MKRLKFSEHSLRRKCQTWLQLYGASPTLPCERANVRTCERAHLISGIACAHRVLCAVVFFGVLHSHAHILLVLAVGVFQLSFFFFFLLLHLLSLPPSLIIHKFITTPYKIMTPLSYVTTLLLFGCLAPSRRRPLAAPRSRPSKKTLTNRLQISTSA